MFIYKELRSINPGGTWNHLLKMPKKDTFSDGILTIEKNNNPKVAN